MRRFIERVLNLLRVRHAEGDLAREIDTHLALMQDAYEARGMTPEQARRAARLALGGIEQTKELHRNARSFAWIEDARQDVRHGIRLLQRSPLFAVTAAMSLAVGIGANTAIFTVANSLLFRPPVGIADPDTLIAIGTARGDGGLNPLSHATYLELARRTTSLAGVFGQDLSPHVMSLFPPDTGIAERIVGQYVTDNFFTVLGAIPTRGRLFTAGDVDVAVLDYGYWARRFNATDSVIGRTLRINGRSLTIIGVSSAGFQGTGIETRDVWLAIPPNSERGGIIAGGRVRADLSVDTAAAEIVTIGDAINRERREDQRLPRLSTLPFSRVGGNRNLVLGFAAVLMVLVSLVLVGACANVMGIVVTRSTARAREMAVRTALGAWRGRLVRQLLTEIIVLYLLGGVMGIALARWLVALTRLLPSLPTPISVPLPLDGRVLLFALALSVCAAIGSGALPAYRGSKANPGGTLKEGAHSSSSRTRLRSALVVGQVALSVLLVVIGALFVRALRYAGATDAGFDPHGVEIASIDLSMSQRSRSDPETFWRNVIERVRQIPSIDDASLVRVPPGGFEGIGLGGIAADTRDQSEMFSPGWNIVDTGYFATLRLPIRAGRDFTSGDRAGAPTVVIVSDSIARRFWPGQDPIGRPVTLAIFNTRKQAVERRTATVIGVAADIKSSSLVDGLADPYVYLPLAQTQDTGMTSTMSIIARQRGRTSLVPQIEAIVRELDPTLVIANDQSLSESIALGLAPQRVLAAVAGTMGVLGLFLASIGIYGVTAYSIAMRRRELGIRLALGAPRGRLIWMVLRQGMALVAIGVAIGVVLATGASQVLSLFLYGLSAVHPPTLFATLLLFGVVGGLACAIPATRAVSGDWRRALQEE
jgi:predicted permease